MGVVVHIDRFSGPMALLLHLIRQEEMDIFDINIHEITKQYLDSIKTMKKMNLEVAGDFIAMAATLIQIKSKMLLPQYNDEGEVIEEEDPRRDLVRRLMEYQAYQDAGQNLYKRSLLGRDVWSRGHREKIEEDAEAASAITIDADNALYSLIAIYRTTIKKMTKAVHRVAASLQSIADRVRELAERLRVGQPATLFALAEGSDQLLITFLSLLELAKMGFVHLFQSENFADVHIETKAPIDTLAISQVETYDARVQDMTAPSTDIWLTEDDTKPLAEGPEHVQMILEEPTVEAATDAEIEAALAESGEIVTAEEPSRENSDSEMGA